MIGAAIIGAELSFWIVLGLSLTCRYLLRRRRLSTIGLLCLPLIDLALVILVAVDLAQGAEPRPSHAFAASYLGFTVAFGHSITRWADRHFAHRFAGGPKPERPAKGSAAYVRQLWLEWARVVLAVLLSTMVLFGLAVVVCRQPIPSSLDEAAHHPLWAQMVPLGIMTVVWFLAGPAFARKSARPSTG